MTKLNELKQRATDMEAQLKEIKAEIERLQKGWEMKVPDEYMDVYIYTLLSSGKVVENYWAGSKDEQYCFLQGNIFLTREAAELEGKRRDLLTRFRAFRDECNESWYPNWKDSAESKYFIGFQDEELGIGVDYSCQHFLKFGYFKEYRNCKKAFELFGDKIKELFVECE